LKKKFLADLKLTQAIFPVKKITTRCGMWLERSEEKEKIGDGSIYFSPKSLLSFFKWQWEPLGGGVSS